MIVRIKQSYQFMEKALKEHTYQSAFSSSVSCIKCRAGAIPLMVIDDDEGLIEQQRPQSVKI